MIKYKYGMHKQGKKTCKNISKLLYVNSKILVKRKKYKQSQDGY